MNLLKSLLIACATIIVVFALVCLLDWIVITLYHGFDTRLSMVITFGIGGIVAATTAYFNGVQIANRVGETLHWSLIDLILLLGVFCFFFLSKIEHKEYEAAFKSFGSTLSLGSCLFITRKIY